VAGVLPGLRGDGLFLEMPLERVRGVAEVLAADHSHRGREQLECALGAHLEFVVDLGRVSVGGEPEGVSALELLDVGDDPYPPGTVELLELLHDLAEPARSHSNRVPSPTSPASSLREARIVGFHAAKLPPSAITSNTSSRGALMSCERVITAIFSSRSVPHGDDRRPGLGASSVPGGACR
jgi:hypothetical protein